MPTITPETAERVKQIEIEVVGLWNLAEDHIDQAHDFAHQAVIAAWSVGKLLIEAKSSLGHGHFGVWREQMGIPQPTAFRYMALAAKYSHVNELPENRRQAYLAIGLLPDKDQVEHQGDVDLKPANHHLSFVNRWANWMNQVKVGKVKVNIDQARLDLKPLYEWMKSEVYGE